MSIRGITFSEATPETTPPDPGFFSNIGRRFTQIVSDSLPTVKKVAKVAGVLSLIALVITLPMTAVFMGGGAPQQQQQAVIKRNAEQASPIRYTVMPQANLFPEIPAQTWKAGSMCVSGNEGLFVGINSTNHRHVKLFNVDSSGITTLQAPSQAITQSFPALASADALAVGCSDGDYRITMQDRTSVEPQTLTYHTAIKNQTVALSEAYLGGGTAAQNGTVTVMPLQGMRSFYAENPGSSYVVRFSEASGAYNATSPRSTIFSVSDISLLGKTPQPLVFDDGSFMLLQARNTTGLFLTQFNTTQQLGQTVEINNGQTLSPVKGAKTAIPKTASHTTLISPNGLHTLDLSALNITATRNFTTGPSTTFSVANCGQEHPTINWYARQVGNTIHFDCVDAAGDSASLLGNEQTLPGTFPTTSDVEIGCDAQGNGVIKLLNQNATSFVVRLDDPITAVPTPTATPISTPVQAPSNAPTPRNSSIVITVDTTSGTVYIDPLIKTIKVDTTNNWIVQFAGNHTDVPVGTLFPAEPLVIIPTNTSRNDTPPVFEGCTEEGDCVKSTRKTQLQVVTGGDGTNIVVIGASAGTIGAVILVAAAVFGLTWYRKHVKEMKARSANGIKRPKVAIKPRDNNQEWTATSLGAGFKSQALGGEGLQGNS